MTERSTHGRAVPREPQRVGLRRRSRWRMDSGGQTEPPAGGSRGDRFRLLQRRAYVGAPQSALLRQRIWVVSQEYSCPIVGREFYVF